MPEDKKPRFLYTLIILDLMLLFVNCWSPLTHACHTSRPCSPDNDMHPKLFLQWLSFLAQPFPGLATGSEYTGLHTLRLGRQTDRQTDRRMEK